MSGRLTFGVFVVLGLAVIIGIIAGQSQSMSVAAPVPTPTPTAIALPSGNTIAIVPNPNNVVCQGLQPQEQSRCQSESPSAVYLSPSQTIYTYQVSVGQTVTWVNRDSSPHSVTADNGAFNSDVLAPGQSFKWTPHKPGTYTYGDFTHPEMHSAITVTG